MTIRTVFVQTLQHVLKPFGVYGANEVQPETPEKLGVLGVLGQ